MSAIPESIESLIEGIRRDAAGLTEYQLDVRIGETLARRNVAAAHGYHVTAGHYNGLLIALADARQMRTEAAREIDDLTGPPAPFIRALTPDELADDERMNPTC